VAPRSVRSRLVAIGAVAAVLLVAACDRGPCPHDHGMPASWVLEGEGFTVEVTRDPYTVTVRDAAGAVVLQSLGEGAGDGYAALGFTGGSVAWQNVVSPGYYQMTPLLNPWKDQHRVVSAKVDETGALRVALEGPNARQCVRVTHTLQAAALRVDATVEGLPPRAWSAAFSSPADEAFLGFGERYNRTDQRGLSLYSWPEEGGLAEGEGHPAGPANPFPNGETMTYYPVPFFLSTRGYGFWLDSTWRNQFDLASERDDAWRVWHLGPSFSYEVFLPPGDGRPWPHQVVDAFTARTGRPMIPPAWSFGPRRRIGAGDQVEGVPEIQAMRDEGLAITVADDARHFLPRGIDESEHDALRAWTSSAKALGYRVFCYYNPYLADDPTMAWRDKYEEGLANGYFLKDANGEVSLAYLISGGMVNIATVDVTSPEARAWFTAMFQPALDLGYSGWMYDFGEYVQPGILAANGMTGEELHNLFPVLYQQAAYEALEAGPHAGDWYTFVRSGYTGASQFSPMVWSGDPDASFDDAEGLPAQVRAGINLSLSGVAHWGSDISGYKCLADGTVAADGELVARWIQAGAMQSNMHDENACTGGGTKANVWNSTEAREAWRTYALLHTRLFPYLYTLAHEAHATGAPLIRHLYFEHPDRRDLAAVDDTHYLGPALLVAPVVARGALERVVPLPPGRYLDWRDQALIEGGAAVTVPAPLDKLPLFLRDGYLVPLLDPSIQTLDDRDHPGVVGPAEVADVYDVVGLLSREIGAASFTLWDGGTLAVTWTGAIVPGALTAAASAAELATCNGCYLVENLGGGLGRVRVSSADAEVVAGGLTLRADVGRRVRWDLYLVE
jgi:sulfoquinovosidase